MRTFRGRLWLVKDPHSQLEAEVLLDLDEERLRITSGETVIGDWPFDQLDVTRDGDEINLAVEGEELVIISGDIWFAPTLGQAFASSERPRHQTDSTPEGHEPDDPESEVDDQVGRDSDRSRRRGAHRRPGSFKLKW